MEKSEQTDQLKYEVYKMIFPFVRKYQPIYYPAYQGDIQDLASDFYIKFMTEKGRDKNKKESLLDKFDKSITTLPYLIKVSVIRALIDEARKDKGERNYDENYDENSNRLSIDFLSGRLDAEQMEQLDEMEFDDSFVETLKSNFRKLSPDRKKKFENYYEEVKSVLSPNFQQLFHSLESEFDSNAASEVIIRLEGKAPNYVAVALTDEGEEKKAIRARNLESAKKKALKAYPGADFIEDSKIIDSCKFLFTDKFINKVNSQ